MFNDTHIATIIRDSRTPDLTASMVSHNQYSLSLRKDRAEGANYVDLFMWDDDDIPRDMDDTSDLHDDLYDAIRTMLQRHGLYEAPTTKEAQ